MAEPQAIVWITGGQGQLGRELVGELSAAGIPLADSDREVDIGDFAAVEKFARGRKLAWLINCAAYTDVDRAETEPEQAFRVNAAGAANLARLAGERQARMIHFSTDYVFDGRQRQPYREEDPANPLSVYGLSKWQGERQVQLRLRNHFIFRLSWLYGRFGKNFVSTMLQHMAEKSVLDVIDDQLGSPTWVDRLAANIVTLIRGDSRHFGLYHCCDRGQTSWFGFAGRIMERSLAAGRLDRAVVIRPIPSSAYSAVAPRPSYSVLDQTRAERELGFTIAPWEENLDLYLNQLPGGKEKP